MWFLFQFIPARRERVDIARARRVDNVLKFSDRRLFPFSVAFQIRASIVRSINNFRS